MRGVWAPMTSATAARPLEATVTGDRPCLGIDTCTKPNTPNYEFNYEFFSCLFLPQKKMAS